MTRSSPPGAVLAALFIASALPACTAPHVPTRFHALTSAAGDGASEPSRPARFISIEPITIPAQVDQPQFIVRQGDGSLVMLEHERWIAPLAEEIHLALAQSLQKRLGAIDVSRLGVVREEATRIRVDVKRLDAEYGRRVYLDASWALTPAVAQASVQTTVCGVSLRQDVGGGYPAIAAGYRALIDQLAARIAATLETNSGGAAVCPP
ncbi:MAG TPA: PqiC family protein [Burkholderiaceae bacterium]|nr:PqiC family protein [Burkholderiaceae bacterium]